MVLSNKICYNINILIGGGRLMKITTCDVCGDKINEEFKGARLGKETTILGIPDYVVEHRPEGKPEEITPYDVCWHCQDSIHRAAFNELQRIKAKTKQSRPKPVPEIFGVGPTLEGMGIHDKINARAEGK